MKVLRKPPLLLIDVFEVAKRRKLVKYVSIIIFQNREQRQSSGELK